MVNAPKNSFYSAMQQSLKIAELINPYHPNKYINFRSKQVNALLNQPGTHTAKALLRTGIIVDPSFTMAGLIHARYFSTFNRFAGILGQTAFERQMDFAAKLQQLQPLLNPEYVRNVSCLAGWADLTFEYARIPETETGEEKQVTIESIIEVLSDTETLDSPYAIGFYQTWKNIPDKAQFLGIVFDLAYYFWFMSSITIDSINGGTYFLTAKALVEVYVLGSKQLTPAVKAGYEEKANAGKSCDNLKEDVSKL